MLDGQPRSASVETIKPSELLVISRKGLSRSRHGHAGHLVGVPRGRVRPRPCPERTRSSRAAFQGTHYRVAKAILRLAEKHGTKTETGIRVARTFGVLKDIGEMAATTAERVERILERPRGRRPTHVDDGDLVIPDLSALRRALDYMGIAVTRRGRRPCETLRTSSSFSPCPRSPSGTERLSDTSCESPCTTSSSLRYPGRLLGIHPSMLRIGVQRGDRPSPASSASGSSAAPSTRRSSAPSWLPGEGAARCPPDPLLCSPIAPC